MFKHLLNIIRIASTIFIFNTRLTRYWVYTRVHTLYCVFKFRFLYPQIRYIVKTEVISVNDVQSLINGVAKIEKQCFPDMLVLLLSFFMLTYGFPANL